MMESQQFQPNLSTFFSIATFLTIFILQSHKIQSQYFDIGESNSSPSALKGEDCSLPATWEGSWFQSGVHQLISINRSTINAKGQCIEADGDKFLFFNLRDNCFRCVVFHEKHSNVLQYKETYCHHTRRSLPAICSTISADFHLLSMFRLDGVPVECPFRGSFTVAYNRGYGNCEFPISTLDSCLDSTRLVLNYQACPNVPGTESTTEELECLATWRESSSRYLLGLIRYHYPASYEERFRCFAYEKVNKQGDRVIHGKNSSIEEENIIFRLAQSGDATCLGLAPNEGSKTLILRKAMQPQPCKFPSWLLRHTEWHTLNQRLVYVFEENVLRISNYSSPSSVTSSSNDDNEEEGEVGEGFGSDTLLTQAVCTQIIQHDHHHNFASSNNDQIQSNSNNNNDSENLTDKITLVLHSTSEWNPPPLTIACLTCSSTGYICMAIYKRDNDIVEIQSGELSRTIENACHPSKFDPDKLQFSTLTSSTPESRECPFLTNFDITSLSFPHKRRQDALTNCQSSGNNEDTSTSSSSGLLSMGCSSIDEIELRSNNKCSAEKIAEKYTCHAWWEESGQNYLVVALLTNNTSSSSTVNNGSPSRKQKRVQRFCLTFHETTTKTEFDDIDGPQLLSLLQITTRRKNQETNFNTNFDANESEKTDELLLHGDEVEGEYDETTRSQQQLRKHIKRQFEFKRYSGSCERESRATTGSSSSNWVKRRRRRQSNYIYGERNDVFDEVRRSWSGGGGDQREVELHFTASTSYYENCNGASSSKSVSKGSVISRFSTISMFIMMLVPVLFT